MGNTNWLKCGAEFKRQFVANIATRIEVGCIIKPSRRNDATYLAIQLTITIQYSLNSNLIEALGNILYFYFPTLVTQLKMKLYNFLELSQL